MGLLTSCLRGTADHKSVCSNGCLHCAAANTIRNQWNQLSGIIGIIGVNLPESTQQHRKGGLKQK